MPRYFVQLEYKGSNYLGFQKQSNTKRTIQGHLEKALSKIANESIKLPVQVVLILVFMRQIKLFTSIQTQEEV